MDTEPTYEELKRLFSIVLDAIDDFLIVIDKDLRVVMSNWKGFEHVPEQERKNFPHCYTLLMGRQTPCEPCHALEVFQTGKAKEFEHLNPSDGKTKNVCLLPVFDDEGRIILVVKHLREITEHKRAEESPGHNEETLKAILAASSSAIGLAQDRTIKWCNKALYDMLGYREGSLEGKSLKTIYANPDDYERVGREIYPIIETGGIGRFETKGRTKDGTTVDAYIQMTALDQKDISKGVIVIGVDVTQHKEAEACIKNLCRGLIKRWDKSG
jgi:PAS domain S-box-containing protein